jgi:hypothetical protein
LCRVLALLCCCVALAACGTTTAPTAQEATTSLTTLPEPPTTTASKPSKSKARCSAAKIRKIDADIRRWERELEWAKRDPYGDTQLAYDALENLYYLAGYCKGVDIDQDPNPGFDSGQPDYDSEPEAPPDYEPDYP